MSRTVTTAAGVHIWTSGQGRRDVTKNLPAMTPWRPCGPAWAMGRTRLPWPTVGPWRATAPFGTRWRTERPPPVARQCRDYSKRYVQRELARVCRL